MYIFYNPNPNDKRTDDHTVRVMAKLLDSKWECAFSLLSFTACQFYEMPTSLSVLGECLKAMGYQKRVIADGKGSEYTVKDFCRDNPAGHFVVITNTHPIVVVDGNYYDNRDSGEEIPLYFWKNELGKI